jgi:hypothetical protein
MKNLAILFLIVLCPLTAFSQEKIAAENKLKTITVHEQKWDDGVAGKILIESVTRFDQSGNVIEEIEYKQGKVVKHFTYKYDAANNKTHETELDAAGKKIKVSVYVYSNGLRKEKTVYDGNNRILSRKTYKYETY